METYCGNRHKLLMRMKSSGVSCRNYYLNGQGARLAELKDYRD